MDMSRFQQGATYEQIQEWIQEKYGFHVTHLNIAKTKRKCGFICGKDEINYVNLSLGNLYHELCHRYIHEDREKNAAKLRSTCKGVFFLIQNMHFLESSHFILTKTGLKKAVSSEDRRVLELEELPDVYDFDQAFSSLFAWCQSAFARIERLGGN